VSAGNYKDARKNNKRENNMDYYDKEILIAKIQKLYEFAESAEESLGNKDLKGAEADTLKTMSIAWEIYKEIRLTRTQGEPRS
jgi:hypothetical protein